MERVYYPSPRKYVLRSIIYPIGIYGLSALLAMTFFLYRRGTLDSFNWHGLWSWFSGFFLFLVFRAIFFEGFDGKRLAIKLSATAVYGPLAVGRDMPIPFAKLDLVKSRKKKRFCSVEGDEIKFDEKMFELEDVKEIWDVVEKLGLGNHK